MLIHKRHNYITLQQCIIQYVVQYNMYIISYVHYIFMYDFQHEVFYSRQKSLSGYKLAKIHESLVCINVFCFRSQRIEKKIPEPQA